ncbi:MAG: endonuclease Q family protein [Methanomicrobiaceae archaeon]|nr:endonuclease Q family protein [Methanomicrobiaceae archaeon]
MPDTADLHLHSPFSMATSAAMTPPTLIDACTRKGISVLGSGDALNAAWRRMWQEHLDNDAGVLVVPTLEVEGKGRIHYLAIMADFEACAELAADLAPHARDIEKAGRPHVDMGGEAIARAVHGLGGLIGPAHAFTPWTGMYAAFDSIRDCFGEETIDFLELGLSADSAYGAGIAELEGIPFLSNSDAHSASPLKLGREFNRLRPGTATVRSVIARVRRGEIAMNAGFFPEEGKYSRTACTRCFTQYSLEEAKRHRWHCPVDRGRIKKGVADRVRELAAPCAPAPRPPYLHLIPLGEIIQRCLGTTSPATKGCMQVYNALIAGLGPEIDILIDMPVADIAEIDPRVAAAVDALREGDVILHPGGGGKYGSFTICRAKE